MVEAYQPRSTKSQIYRRAKRWRNGADIAQYKEHFRKETTTALETDLAQFDPIQRRGRTALQPRSQQPMPQVFTLDWPSLCWNLFQSNAAKTPIASARLSLNGQKGHEGSDATLKG
jgi:hypothetical protein